MLEVAETSLLKMKINIAQKIVIAITELPNF
jgi:hypothetical protein